jgi:ATP-dependent protease Clp ATPase subunit
MVESIRLSDGSLISFIKNVNKEDIMKFVLIFGPQAVGKMTVGQELEKITELKLFHI